MEVAREIAGIVDSAGFVKISDLVQRFSLPTQFVNDVCYIQNCFRDINAVQRILARYIPEIIHGKVEEGAVYTPVFLSQYRCQTRGYFTALTKPTAVSMIRNRFETHKSFFDG